MPATFKCPNCDAEDTVTFEPVFFQTGVHLDIEDGTPTVTEMGRILDVPEECHVTCGSCGNYVDKAVPDDLLDKIVRAWREAVRADPPEVNVLD